ncbi:MAG: zf-HC2 domain-containing protein [Nitrospira sp.]|jgi:anti-sigma factor RsiW|nr:zf-HC2 domain-containing protein [Nitrospira sp. BO4]
MAKRSAYGRQQHSAATRHRHDHGKSRCLNILRKLSAYIDDELSGSICREIRRHLGACSNCETFVASLRQIVSLCRRSQVPTLSTAERAFMRRKILQTAQTR